MRIPSHRPEAGAPGFSRSSGRSGAGTRPPGRRPRPKSVPSGTLRVHVAAPGCGHGGLAPDAISQGPAPSSSGGVQGRPARGDTEAEGRLLQHRRRAGAEDSGSGRSSHIRVPRCAAHAARDVRTESKLARGARGQVAGRKVSVVSESADATPDVRTASVDPPSRRSTIRRRSPPTGRRRFASRRWRTPASRRCSKSFRRRFAISRNCSGGRRRGSIGANMNIQQMMKQAQQMQEQLQRQMAELRIEASAGGGGDGRDQRSEADPVAQDRSRGRREG